MAETVSALAARLGTWLGKARTTTTEASRLQQAVISAIHQALADGAPGIAREVLSAGTWGTLAVTLTHSAGATTAMSGTALTGKNVLPGDFLRAVDGNDYTLYSVAEATDTVGFGAPVQASISGAATIYRRGVVLPTAGQVLWVGREEGGYLHGRDTAVRFQPHETGTPEFYEQRWDSTGERSVLLLYPAPQNAERVLVGQAKDLGALSSGTSIPWRPAALDAVLRDAHKLWLAWSGGASEVEAGMSAAVAREGMDARQNSTSGGAIING